MVLSFLPLAGCGLFRTASPPVYQDASLTVWVEPNPSGPPGPITETDAQYVTAEQLAFILKGLKASQRIGLLQSLLNQSQAIPVFLDDELPRVGKALRIGLRAASSKEQVAFRLSRTDGMEGRAEIHGAVYLRGSLLYVTITKLRSSDRVSSDSPEEGFDLSYEPTEAVVQREPSVIIVNVQRFREASAVAAPEVDAGRKADRFAPPPGRASEAAGARQAVPAPPPPAAPAPGPEILESLQRQIKDLTDSNQELRAKLLELQNRPDRSEELDRLRQELAETRQALADTVIELNRLKSKTGGGAKGRPKSSPGR
jgi:hypothetical protein